MNNMPNIEEILDNLPCGYHQYIFKGKARISYVSKNLCEMLGVSSEELAGQGDDGYARLVYPADTEEYNRFIDRAARGEKSIKAEYRLVKKNGEIIYVRDSLVSKISEDGTLVGHSTITDITDIKNENTDLKLIKEAIPYGFLRYTCEKQPKITYINEKMVEMLRFPQADEGELDYLELYKSNIFLMIPMEERRRFSKYLNRVYSSDTPIAGDMTILRCDGTRARVFGLVTKCVGHDGTAEFHSICMDVTERYQSRKNMETQRYIKALSDVYDKIFEFNLDANSIKCLHCGKDSGFKNFENVAMQIDDALDKWLVGSVATENRDEVRSFFNAFCQKRSGSADEKPRQVTYKAMSSNGEIKNYAGVFIKFDEAISFYCCRELKEVGDSVALKNENDKLKENMRDLVMQFSDGIAAFEISPEGYVKPLYASENVCEFFGYTNEEWIPLTKKYTPLESFVAYSEAAYEDYLELLRTGEAEFIYFDYKTETERKIKAICSQREPDSHSARYVMLYYADGDNKQEKNELPENRAVSIRTFGYFDVFVGDNPIAFRNKKAKELFALLVDRRGGYVTSEEAISFLWEDEPVNAVTLSRYRKVALRLKGTLEEYGISEVVESVDGKRRIVPQNVKCDLFDYLTGEEEYSQLFKGSYLTNYSWAETTLGELTNNRQ